MFNNFVTYWDQIKFILQKPEKVFVILAAVFGIFMSFSLPLFQAPDEPIHFYRAYQVGEGHFISETRNGITGGEVRQISEEAYINRKNTSEVFVPFPSSALYSPVAYIPQAIGIDVGRLINPTVDTMAHIGRLFNLMAYIFLVWLAIRIAKGGKWVYAVVGLFPMAIQQASSLSTDVMTTGLVFVTIALLQNMFWQKKTMSKKQQLFIITLAILLALTKQTNIVFLLPILFLPKQLFSSLRKKIIFLSLIFGSSLLAILCWYMIIKFNHYTTDFSSLIPELQGVDHADQIKYVLTHPLDFAQTLYRTFIFEGFGGGVPLADFYWVSMYGFFGGLAYKMPFTLILLGYIVLLLALLERSPILNKSKQIINLALINTMVFLIALIGIGAALYVVWTPVAGPQIAGIQGRYFIPLIPLLIPLFQYLSRFVGIVFDKPYRIGLIVTTASIISLSTMLFLTYKFY